jgi:hypothetical protein
VVIYGLYIKMSGEKEGEIENVAPETTANSTGPNTLEKVRFMVAKYWRERLCLRFEFTVFPLNERLIVLKYNNLYR